MSHDHSICELLNELDRKEGITYKYFLTVADQRIEVSKEEWVKAERAAGFRNTMGHPEEPGTGGWSAGGISGSIERIKPSLDPGVEETPQ